MARVPVDNPFTSRGGRATIITSVIFATWHLPAILIDGFNYPRQHLQGAAAMYVFALPFSIVMCWLRSATRSVVAPATRHAQRAHGVIYATTSRSSSIIAAPVGLLGAVPLAIVSLLLLLSGRLWRREDGVSPSP